VKLKVSKKRAGQRTINAPLRDGIPDLPEPFVFPAHPIRDVPSTGFCKSPKASVIDNGRRRNGPRQLDECAPLAFNYTSILSARCHWSSVCPSVHPAVHRSVGRSVGRSVRYFGRSDARSMAGTGARGSVPHSAVPEYLWGPKSN